MTRGIDPLLIQHPSGGPFYNKQGLCSKSKIILSVPNRETANTKKSGQKKHQQRTQGVSTLPTPGPTYFHRTNSRGKSGEKGNN